MAVDKEYVDKQLAKLNAKKRLGVGKELKHLHEVINKGENLNIYHVGTDKEISISDLVHQISKLLNKNIIIRPGSLQHGSTLRRCPDITKLKKLGFNNIEVLKAGIQKSSKKLELMKINKDRSRLVLFHLNYN